MTKHIHADLMMQYAQDAQETDKPWERWECTNSVNGGDIWRNLYDHPKWEMMITYRRKPSVIKIGNFEFPRPLTTPPELNDLYYVVNIENEYPMKYKWQGCHEEKTFLYKCLCHRTAEAASQHLAVLIAISQGKTKLKG